MSFLRISLTKIIGDVIDMQTIEINEEDVQAEGYLQAIMSIAFKKWQAHNNKIRDILIKMQESDTVYTREEIEVIKKEIWSMAEWLDTLSEIEKFAVAAGKFNYQVEDGGWGQWMFNGFMKDTTEILVEFLPMLPQTEGVKVVKDFIDRLYALAEKHEWGEGEYLSDEVEEYGCDECGGDGTNYNEETEEWEDCEECGGEGYFEEDKYVAHADELYKAVDPANSFDDLYYSVKKDFLASCNEFFKGLYEN